MKCQSCGSEVRPGQAFCPNCGEKVADTYCVECGKPVNRGIKICPYCGKLPPIMKKLKIIPRLQQKNLNPPPIKMSRHLKYWMESTKKLWMRCLIYVTK